MTSGPSSADIKMKITIAIFLVLAIASFGLTVWVLVRPNSGNNLPLREARSTAPGSPDKTTAHPVTPEMTSNSAAQSNRVAPSFALEGTDGNMHRLAQDTLDRPLVLVFIMNTCPCSTTAQPFFNKLWQAFHDKVAFLGVINSDMTEAKAWQSTNNVPFPILPDPKEAVIRSYKAEHSAYSALITSNGDLEKLWPGFSKTMLQATGKRLAELTGQKPPDFSFADAPEKMFSGCPFTWTMSTPASGANGIR
jgi:peroxiredoxin